MDKKTIILFDIDSTLTPPRQPINKEMADILSGLSIPFAVVAGSHMDLLHKQFFIPLFEHGFRGIFDAFVSNGTMRYHCDYRNEMKIEPIFSFNLREYLGKKNYQELIAALEEVLGMEEFALPPGITIVPNKITDRTSMVNFMPMGRVKLEGPGAQENRKRFVAFSESTGYRNKIKKYLEEKLKRIIEEKKLKILLGGQTSFDIVVDGYDKTYPLYTLRSEGWSKTIFIGDALFPGGNDFVVQEYIDGWSAPESCPHKAIRTEDWKQTIEILEKRGFIK